ncbi:MAG TPA: hypothetical protein DEG47_01200, partial [Cyanobacteria bacterium UBA11148]|nr:hypothetical protein [Cyanobacteria bacterium UBA11148]
MVACANRLSVLANGRSFVGFEHTPLIHLEELIMAHRWQYCWLILGAALIVMGRELSATARSGDIFAPYQQQIQDNLPPGLQMRLPSEVPSSVFSPGTPNQYRIRVIPSTPALGLTVSIFNCEQDEPTCLVGSFAVDSLASIRAREALQQHQAAATPITLAPDRQGYLWEGSKQNPPSPFSSVMWEQDGQIYTVRFRVQQRQNMLYMASSMAKTEPIGGTVAAVAGGVGENSPEPVTPPILPRVLPSPATEERDVNQSDPPQSTPSPLASPVAERSHSLPRLLPSSPTIPQVAKVDESVAVVLPSFPSTEVAVLSDNLFTPYQEQIQHSLPVGWKMRLPSQILLNDTSKVEKSQYRVLVSRSASGSGLTVSLLSCDRDPLSCLVGSFSVDTQANTEVQQALAQHQAKAAPITLTDGIQGYYWLEPFRSNPPSQFSSVMWQQDGLIYRVRFSALERQNILYMARLMAIGSPIFSTSTTTGVTDLPPPLERPILVALKIEPSGSGVGDINSRNLASASLGTNTSEPEASTSQDSSKSGEECRLDSPSRSGTPKPVVSIPITVKGKPGFVEVKGSTVFDADTIAQRINPMIEKLAAGSLTQEQFDQEISDAITQLYLENDYLTSKAILSKMTENTLEIEILEGRLQQIQIEGRKRLNLGYICNRIKLAAGTPVNTTRLEEQLRLLRVSPHFENVEASLRGTGNPSESTLIVRVKEANPFTFNWNIDNYSPPSIGSERLGIGFRYLNLTGLGDILTGSYRFTTTGGADIFDFTYQIPVNPMEGAFLLRVAPNRNEITQSPFDELGIKGETELYQIAFRQPLVRTPREELALSVGFTFQEGQTFLFDQLPTPFGLGPDQNGVSRTSVFTFSQDYIRR